MTSDTTMEGMTDSIVSYKLELTGQVAAGQMQPAEMNEALDTNAALIRELGYTTAQVRDMHGAADDIIEQMNKDLGSL